MKGLSVTYRPFTPLPIAAGLFFLHVATLLFSVPVHLAFCLTGIQFNIKQ